MQIIKFVVAIAVVTVLVGEERPESDSTPALVTVDEHQPVALPVVQASSQIFAIFGYCFLIALAADQIWLLTKTFRIFLEFFPTDGAGFLFLALGKLNVSHVRSPRSGSNNYAGGVRDATDGEYTGY